MRHNTKLFNALRGLPMNFFEPHQVANNNLRIVMDACPIEGTPDGGIQDALDFIACELQLIAGIPLTPERCNVLSQGFFKHSETMKELLDGVIAYLRAQGLIQ